VQTSIHDDDNNVEFARRVLTRIAKRRTYAFTRRMQAQARRVRFFTRFTWTTPVEV
jgi:hypothetical protein